MTSLLQNSVVFVTGANGGLGGEFVRQSLAAGASRVYASARTPRAWSDDRVVPVELDVTNAESIAAAVATAPDTTIVVNNAGITRRGSIATATRDDVRAIFDTNVFGALEVAQGFAPVLAANGGGALLNVLSVLSLTARGAAYSASKAAFWSISNSLRLELAAQGTLVSSLYLGYTDTPMTIGIDSPKNDPADVVRAALDGLAAGDWEVLADEVSASTRALLSEPLDRLYPELARP